MAIDEVLKALTGERMILFTVHPRPEYHAGRLLQACTLSVAKLENELAELPHAQEIAAYCRDYYYVLADVTVVLLRTHRYTARRLQEGVVT